MAVHTACNKHWSYSWIFSNLPWSNRALHSLSGDRTLV